MEFFKVKFRNSRIAGIVGMIGVKLRGSESISYWTEYTTFIFDHTHDPKFEIVLSKEWKDRLTWHERYVRRPFMKQRTCFTLDKEGLKLHSRVWVTQLF